MSIFPLQFNMESYAHWFAVHTGITPAGTLPLGLKSSLLLGVMSTSTWTSEMISQL